MEAALVTFRTDPSSARGTGPARQGDFVIVGGLITGQHRERPALALSFDFEDWTQLVRRRLGADDWDRAGDALGRQMRVVFGLLDELGARATFFLLGITAARYPQLVEQIAQRGHEVACHGYAHLLVCNQTAGEFRSDV